MKKYIMSKLHRIPLATFQNKPLYKAAHNLSGMEVPVEVMTLLAKGLKFVPDFRHTHAKDLVQAAARFIRAINSAVYFRDRGLPTRAYSRFRLPRAWSPPLSAEGLQTAFKLEQLISNWSPSKPSSGSWSYFDRCALRWLKLNRSTVMICDSDKNMGVTICSTTWVLGQAQRHIDGACTLLSGQDWEISTYHAINEAKAVIDRAVRLKVLTHAERSFVVADFQRPVPGQFRILPKIHKNPVESRPIFSAGQSWTRRLADWLTQKLSVLLDGASTVALSSDDVQARMKDWQVGVHEKLVLVTLDIEALYPSISLPHLKWTLAVLIRSRFPVKEAEVIIKMLEIVLHYNEAQWQGKVFRITQGVATGSPASVVIANAYLLSLDKHICDFCCLRGYQRYVDDLLVLCHPAEVENLVLHANSFQSSIALKKSGEGRENIVFLDMELHLDCQNRVVTSLYSKPMALFDYTPYSSTHPSFVFHGMAKAEAWRYCKRSSNPHQAEVKLQVLRKRLAARGIPHSVITRAFREVRAAKNCPKAGKVSSGNVRPLFFVVQYSHTSNVSMLRRMLRSLPTKVGKPMLALKVQRSLFRHLYGQWTCLRDTPATMSAGSNKRKKERADGRDPEHPDAVVKLRRVSVL